jgi:hypothetical protein
MPAGGTAESRDASDSAVWIPYIFRTGGETLQLLDLTDNVPAAARCEGPVVFLEVGLDLRRRNGVTAYL